MRRLWTLLGWTLTLCLIVPPAASGSEFNAPWRDARTSLVIDAYEYTKIDWAQLPRNKRLVGFINKASDGLPPKYGCQREKLCRALWKRYAAARELYHTRKHLAKALGLKWGAYHLARPGNPIEQAQHFLNFTDPDKDDLLALDIEDNDPSKWMSLADAERFAIYVRKRTGRYPVLYTNHSTAKHIADRAKRYPVLSKMNLWYARYRRDLPGAFPLGRWDSYTMWQFSSQVNCNRKSCLKRLVGTTDRIDINVVNLSPAQTKAAWPFAELRQRPLPAVEVPAIATGPGAPVLQASLATGNDGVLTGRTTMAYVAVPVWRPGATIVRRERGPSETLPEPALVAPEPAEPLPAAAPPVLIVRLDNVLDDQKKRFPWYRLARTRYTSDEAREMARLAFSDDATPEGDDDRDRAEAARPAPAMEVRPTIFTGRGRSAPVFLRSDLQEMKRQVLMLQASFLR